jgi:hypothetical protein
MKFRAFLIIFVLVFATRFAYFLHSRPFRSMPDGSYGKMYEMESSADHIAREGRMADVFAPGSGPSAHVAPLYAFYLAGVDRLAGLEVGRFRFLHGLSAMLATSLFAALLPSLARRAGLSPGVGVGAACLVALSPFGLWMEIRGDWETAWLPLALVVIFWALMAFQDREWVGVWRAIFTGVLFGLGGLLSPVVLLAGLAGIFFQTFDGRARNSRMFRAVPIILTACALTIAPWVYRNYLCFSAFVPIRDNLGIEMAVGNNPRADGSTFGDGFAAHPLKSRTELARLVTLGEVPYNKEKMSQALSWISYNPSKFAWLSCRRLLSFWFPSDQGMLKPLPLLPIVVQALAIGMVTALAFVGLGWLFATGHAYRMLFLAILVAPSLPYIVTHVSYRYRYPINGFVALLCCECVARALATRRAAPEPTAI